VPGTVVIEYDNQPESPGLLLAANVACGEISGAVHVTLASPIGRHPTASSFISILSLTRETRRQRATDSENLLTAKPAGVPGEVQRDLRPNEGAIGETASVGVRLFFKVPSWKNGTAGAQGRGTPQQ
jgi:hypothetical protein